jgi:beta-glucanase (GH16 family)
MAHVMDHRGCQARSLESRALGALCCLLFVASCEHINDIGSLATSAEAAAGDAGLDAADDVERDALDAAVDGTAVSDAGWRLVFSDEFDAPAGSRLDPSKWNVEVGPDLDDQQLQYNSDRPENLSLDGQHLVITAREESPALMGMDYSSARINTAMRFEPMYGRFEASIQVPVGTGLVAQWWLLGNDWGAGAGKVPWPDCGDITIMEYFGSESTHCYQQGYTTGYVDEKTWPLRRVTELPGRPRLADGFHVYAAEWEENAIRWYIDGAPYLSAAPADLPEGGLWAFNHPFFLILYLGIGGTAGPPGAGTVFPQSMRVDYVRVYTRQ